MNSYLNFYSKIREKKSHNLLNDLLKFINVSFNEIMQTTDDMSQISITVQEFISKSVTDFAKIWEVEFPNNRLAYSEICDGFESLITKSLYSQIITQLDDKNKFERLYRKYSFVNLKNLGIEIIVDEFELANQLKNLNELNMYRAPKEKLTLIVNFCNFILYKYKFSEKSYLVKFVVFSLLKANIQNLKANLKFIALFRHKTTITSDEDYFLSIFFQAVEFIEKLNPQLLKINKNLFIEYCDEFEKKEMLRSSKNEKISDDILVSSLNRKIENENSNLFKIDKSTIVLNKNNGIFNLDTDRLYNTYCSNNFNENSIGKFENMYNDFKIMLKIVESIKNENKSEDINNKSVTLNIINSTRKENANLIDI